MRRHFDIYVDDRYIETLYTGWPIARLMRQLHRKYPDAKTLEARKREEEQRMQCGLCARIGTNDTSVRAHAPGCDRSN